LKWRIHISACAVLAGRNSQALMAGSLAASASDPLEPAAGAKGPARTEHEANKNVSAASKYLNFKTNASVNTALGGGVDKLAVGGTEILFVKQIVTAYIQINGLAVFSLNRPIDARIGDHITR
jgi:hypothetical protein